MITTNHTTLQMSGVLNIEHLTALKLHVGVNAHGWATVEGEAVENALEQLSGALAGREQHILTLDESGMEKCLFAGVIREAELVRVGGYNRFHVELLSGTCLMDREIRSRSFQDVSQTYSQVAQQVCSEYSSGAAICTVGEDKTFGKPVIQYRETDWEFLMRMASHCGGVLVPETHRGLPRLWFGFPDRSFTCEFPEDAYTSGISQRYYELGGSAAGYSKSDFFYYDVESPQLCDLGWYTVFKGQPFIIFEKYAILERGELIFTYRLGRPGLGWGKMLYNEKISGMTLLGEVLETSRETLKLKLDIDAGWNPGGPYPYTWRPETGNFMYCIPQVGTRVSLYCPNYDEKTAIAINCVRTNGGNCDRMSDPAKRSFVTEHGKEMNLYPEEMSLVGSAMDNIWGKILVSDDEGVSFNSPKPIYVIAKEDVVMASSTLNAHAVNGELLTATCNTQTGNVESSVVQSGQYDLGAVATNAKGSNCVEYNSYDDAPKESPFEWGKLVFNVLAGLAMVAVIATISVTTAGLGTAAMVGAIAVGSTLVIGKAVSDRISGTVSDVFSYMFTGIWGATVGAVLGYTAYNWSAIWSSIKAIPDMVRAFLSTPIPWPPFPPPSLAPQLAGGMTMSAAASSATAAGQSIFTVGDIVGIAGILFMAATGQLGQNQGKQPVQGGQTSQKGPPKVDAGGDKPQDYLDKALEEKGLDSIDSIPEKGMKANWIDGEYKYEVRVHPGEDQYTSADRIYRVSRQRVPSVDPTVQGTGIEYLGSDGNWYHQSVLRATNKGGIPNPLFNSEAARLTHIPLLN